MRVIVAGSRTITSYDLVRAVVDQSGFLHVEGPHEVLSGHARGVDQLAERYAREYNYTLRIIPAQWERYGRQAGFIRNEEMADNADALVAIWDGKSRGTKHMIDTAKRKGLKVFVLNTKTDCSCHV